MSPIVFRPLVTTEKDLYCPQCYYLEIEEARVLLDAGTYESGECELGQEAFNEGPLIEALRELAPTLTLILISNPKPSALGLLPLLVNHLKLPATCQVYASPPTVSLGRLALREWASHLCLELDPGISSSTVRTMPEQVAQASVQAGWKFNPPQLNKALSRLIPIRFSSPLLLSGRNAPLTLIANRAGHTLGGTIWTLRTPTNEEITYAPAWNHVKERTLDGATNLVTPAQGSSSTSNKLRQKGLLLMNSERSKFIAPKTVTKYKAFLENVTATLKSNHSVLIPCDASARLVEFLVLLDQHWSFTGLGADYPLCFISKTAEDLKLALKNIHEFFGSNMTQPTTPVEEPVFVCNNVKFFPSIEAFNKTYPPTATSPIPKVILSVPESFSYGFSRVLFTEYATKEGNLIILNGPGEQGSLANVLFQRWKVAQNADETWGNAKGRVGKAVHLAGEEIALKLNRKAFLEGEQLAAYQEVKTQEAAEKAKQKALSDRTRRLKEAADAAEDDSSADEDDASSGEDEPEDDADAGLEAGMDDATMKDVTNRQRTTFVDAEGGAGLYADGLTTGIYDEFIGDEKNLGSFDIYVGGAQNRSEFTIPIKRENGELYFPPLREQQRFRMYPFVERKRKVDAYGEVVDVAAWLSRGKNEADQAEAAKDVLGKRKRDEENAQKEKAEAPHKFVSETISVRMACSVFVVDMEGKADGRALKTLLPHLNPKKLIILGGDRESAEELEASCRANTTMTREIFAPAVSEIIQVGDDAKSFSIRLEEGLLSTLRLRRVDDYDIVAFRGAVNLPDVSSIPTLNSQQNLLDPPAEGGRSTRRAHRPLSILTNLEARSSRTNTSMDVDSNEDSLPPLNKTLFIGDVRLFALKQQLNKAGIPAAFAGEGVLVCGPVKNTTAEVKGKSKKVEETDELDTSGGQVAVRKSRAGELALEGSPGDTFYAVRQVLYSVHAET